MTLIELKNSNEFGQYKNNLKLLMVIVENDEQYNKISGKVKKLSDNNPNILFLILKCDVCKDLEICQSSKPISFVCSVNGTEKKRVEAKDADGIEDLISFLNNHTMI